MHRTMLKSKIHRATVTGSELHYPGSLTVDPELLEAADILEHEQVAGVDVDNGQRFETCAIAAEERGTGALVVNGAAARLVQPGDTVIVFSYAAYDAEVLRADAPRVVHVDPRNAVVEVDYRAAEFAAGMPEPAH